MFGRLALLGEVGLPDARDEPFSGVQATVDYEGANQRLDHVANHILALACAILAGLLAKMHKRWNSKLAADLGTCFARHQHIVAAREIAFGLARVPIIERPGHHMTKDPIPEELEPFIIVGPDARVGEGEL